MLHSSCEALISLDGERPFFAVFARRLRLTIKPAARSEDAAIGCVFAFYQARLLITDFKFNV